MGRTKRAWKDHLKVALGEVAAWSGMGVTEKGSKRAWKGYSTTFAFNRPLFHLVGHYKLDWFFVKPAAADHAGSAFNQRFHPYFGRALREVDEAVEGRISDHYPITVDLPLTSGAP